MNFYANAWRAAERKKKKSIKITHHLVFGRNHFPSTEHTHTHTAASHTENIAKVEFNGDGSSSWRRRNQKKMKYIQSGGTIWTNSSDSKKEWKPILSLERIITLLRKWFDCSITSTFHISYFWQYFFRRCLLALLRRFLHSFFTDFVISSSKAGQLHCNFFSIRFLRLIVFCRYGICVELIVSIAWNIHILGAHSLQSSRFSFLN